MQIEPKNIKNILAVRNDRFGEFLLNIPALGALKETFTNAKITAVVNPSVKELAECVLAIDEIVEWNLAAHSLAERLRLIRLLRRKKIDMAVILNPSKEFHVLTFLAGIPIRIGYDRKCGFLLTHKMDDNKYLGRMHEIEYNLELVSLAGARTENKALSLSIDDEILKGMPVDYGIEDYRGIIAIHPWTSDAIKQWPLENFSELARKISKEKEAKVIIVGAKEELGRSKYFFENLDNNIINLTGKTTLRQLAAILKKCKLLISGDSGPVHLASCVGAKVVAIFRSDMPGKGSWRWGPVSKGSIVIENSSLLDITVDLVFDKVKELLEI